ncbi:hypothetical protein TWF730_009048 [Orbilia blumenaviensis]|uniref:Uncharacterized protein n=1 Tax=Orbilia blumenaviensis TaxID=1796055 RepID=A0AAV9UXD7_9PEZI
MSSLRNIFRRVRFPSPARAASGGKTGTFHTWSAGISEFPVWENFPAKKLTKLGPYVVLCTSLAISGKVIQEYEEIKEQRDLLKMAMYGFRCDVRIFERDLKIFEEHLRTKGPGAGEGQSENAEA